jgi:hypothetical protein
MSYRELAEKMGMTYRAVSEDAVYLESPLVIPEDGSHIGAYLMKSAGGSVRITDDANTLFHSLTYGVKASPSRGKYLKAIAEQCGVSLSDDGEVFAVCGQEELLYYLPRFLEAADRIAFASHGYRPVPSSAFETMLAHVLAKAFPHRLKRNFRVHGASGHQLNFPFVIDTDKDEPHFLQLVAAQEGKANWSSVYQALGKMTDLKNNSAQQSRRLVVLEQVSAKDVSQASTALADAATVMVYTTAGEFVQQLQRLAA